MTTPETIDNEPVGALALSVDEVAIRLGLETPVSDKQQTIITTAIADAQADVEGYLGRPITPSTYTDHNVYEQADWPGYVLREPKVITVLSAAPDTDTGGYPTGTWSVTYTAGIDAANDRQYAPIKRYLIAAVLNDPAIVRLWQAAQGTTAVRRERNVSVEGQSVSYEYLTPTGVDTSDMRGRSATAQQTPGMLSLNTLDRWRLRGRRVFQRRTMARDPFWR